MLNWLLLIKWLVVLFCYLFYFFLHQNLLLNRMLPLCWFCLLSNNSLLFRLGLFYNLTFGSFHWIFWMARIRRGRQQLNKPRSFLFLGRLHCQLRLPSRYLHVRWLHQQLLHLVVFNLHRHNGVRTHSWFILQAFFFTIIFHCIARRCFILWLFLLWYRWCRTRGRRWSWLLLLWRRYHILNIFKVLVAFFSNWSLLKPSDWRLLLRWSLLHWLLFLYFCFFLNCRSGRLSIFKLLFDCDGWRFLLRLRCETILLSLVF